MAGAKDAVRPPVSFFRQPILGARQIKGSGYHHDSDADDFRSR
jgi:hypothetical protein